MSFLFQNTDEKFEKMYEEHLLSKDKIKVDEKSSFKDKKEREEYKEYQRLLKKKLENDAYREKLKEGIKKITENADRKRQRLQKLEEKFNPNKDKPSIYKDNIGSFDYKEIGINIQKNKEKFENKIITLKKQNPKISLEEAILRTYRPTGSVYENDEIIKIFKLEKGPPNPPPLPSPPKRSSPKKSKSKITKKELEMAKIKLKPKGPPNPPPLPSPPKRSSPKKSKSKLTKEGLEMGKSKLKHIKKNIKPDNPDYYLEMAFRNLEK